MRRQRESTPIKKIKQKSIGVVSSVPFLEDFEQQMCGRKVHGGPLGRVCFACRNLQRMSDCTLATKKSKIEPVTKLMREAVGDLS